ncbi:MAG: LytR/AlgR family response regulator transcription factor [Fidelibacterota bacterium]
MTKIRCLIVDDEPLAREVIKGYLEKMPEFELIATSASAIEAFQIISQTDIDLMFLDINMPELSGIDFLKNIKNPPSVIMTTAHREYALVGFELDVVDYLLKPIRFERFLKAIDKFKNKLNRKKDPNVSDVQNSKSDTINIKADRKIYKINLDDVLYVESEGDYIKLSTSSKVILSKQPISSLEKELPGDRFIRIHRSTIVAITKIESFDTTMIEIKKRQFPIGRNYSDQVLKILKK